MIRRGGRLEFRYHQGCFQGGGDPRQQELGTFRRGKWVGKIQEQPPRGQFSKMRTTSHWSDNFFGYK